MLTDWLVCIVYVSSGFILVFTKLTNKLILDITVSLCMVLHEYMHAGYTKIKKSFPQEWFLA